MKRLSAILIILALALSASGRVATFEYSSNIDSVKYYADIPGVTPEEISAIEALKSDMDRFTYGDALSTEAFRLEDGTYAGFMSRLCELFTELFGMNFVPVIYKDWTAVTEDLDNRSIDFIGGMSATPERMSVYHMSQTIADRSLRAFTHADSAEIVSESDIEGCCIGFFPGTVTAEYIEKYYSVSFEPMYFESYPLAVEALRNGVISAFIVDAVADVAFEEYDDIHSREVFPLVYYPVSITTAKDELEPLISVIDKYLSAGGADKLYELYKDGEYDYARYKLGKSFTPGERAYLDDLAKRGEKVGIGLEHDNYPISFYNAKDNEFQGIALDVIAEIGRLTNIRFESLTTRDATWAEILEKLKTGEISMASQLLRSEEREDHFIWSAVPYASSYYALISKSDYPYLTHYQVSHESVGVVRKTALEDMYNKWFPDADNLTYYDTHYESLSALEKGDINLLMGSEHILLTQMNYFEKPGYKINIPFDAPMESYFGFNKNEEILCSIIDKAQSYVKTDVIERDWTNRTYDYEKKLSDLRNVYLSLFAGILSLVLILLIMSLLNNNRLSRESKKIERQEAESRQAALAAEEASRMKSVFLANMSHEIRTPMNSIVGFAELALDSDPKPQVREFLQKIKYSSEVLLNIINDILDVSKIEAGRISLENIPFNMHDIFAVCQTIIEPRALEKGVVLYCYAEPSVGKKLLGDPTRLRQALLNLLSNAVKFTNTGVVKLLSSIEENTGDSVTVRFEVKDSGIGLSPEQLQRIFEPFIQADESTTRRYGGTGLGLSITKNVIELMGGELTVESSPGVGSKFSFALTFKTVDEPADMPETVPAPYTSEKPVFTGEVLVCEDNALNQEVICEQLSRVGLSTVVASNGKECVDIVRGRAQKGGEPFDLIFMDIHMPVMDGLDAAKQLVRLGSKTPIVALTANVMPNDRETYRNHGMPDYLAKPFKTKELWDCLRRYFIPVRSKAINEDSAVSADVSDADERLNRRLLSNFAKDNRTTCGDIHAALEAGDIKLAHRLAHTLKGVAGLIGEANLQQAAYALELALDEGRLKAAPEMLGTLRPELDAVLARLEYFDSPTPRASGFRELDKQEALDLLDRLDTMLKNGDSDCLDLVDRLSDIPGTEALIAQIDQYDFEPARKTLEGIRGDLEVQK